MVGFAFGSAFAANTDTGTAVYTRHRHNATLNNRFQRVIHPTLLFPHIRPLFLKGADIRLRCIFRRPSRKKGA